MKKCIIILFPVLLVFFLFVGCNEAAYTYATPYEAVKRQMRVLAPDEYIDSDTLELKYDEYIHKVYDTITFDDFTILIITSYDNRISVLCAEKQQNGEYSCRGMGCDSYEFPVKQEKLSFSGHKNKDKIVAYTLHPKMDTPVSISGIPATTTDYTVELGGQTQELQFSYAVLDDSAIDEGVDITY